MFGNQTLDDNRQSPQDQQSGGTVQQNNCSTPLTLRGGNQTDWDHNFLLRT